jgi:hypothetical protein
MTMLTDGIKSRNLEDEIQQLDVAEVLEKSVVPRWIVPAGATE